MKPVTTYVTLFPTFLDEYDDPSRNRRLTIRSGKRDGMGCIKTIILRFPNGERWQLDSNDLQMAIKAVTT